MACTDAHRRVIAPIAALAAVLLLSACSVAGPRKSPLPDDGPDMRAIYDGHRTGGRRPDLGPREHLPARPLTGGELPDPRTRSIVDQIEQRFPRAPNPDLVMYVYPHLAQGRYPVPGYFTAFPMYERVEYLLPGEATAWRPSAGGLPMDVPGPDSSTTSAPARVPEDAAAPVGEPVSESTRSHAPATAALLSPTY